MNTDRSFASIQGLLTRAAADGVADPKAFEGNDPKAAVEFILRQISMAVLGRVLTFSCQGHPDLVCEVSGRRLVAVPSLDTNAAQEQPDGPGWLDDFVSTVTEICATAPKISVAVTPLDNSRDQWQKSVSLDQLAKAFDLDKGLAPTEGAADSIALFLAQAGDAIVCAECIAGEAVETLMGADADLQRLNQRASAILPGLADQNGQVFATLGRRGMLFMGTQTGAAEELMVGAFDGVYLVGLVKPQAHIALPTVWLETQSQVA